MKHEGEEVLGAAAPLEPLLCFQVCLICFFFLFFFHFNKIMQASASSLWVKESLCQRSVKGAATAGRLLQHQPEPPYQLCSLFIAVGCLRFLSHLFLFFQWQPLSVQAGSGPADPGSVRKSRFHGWAASLCFTLSWVDLRKPLTRSVCPVVSHRGGDQQHEERAGEVRHPDARLQQDRRHPGQWAVCGRGCTWEMALMMSQGEGPGVWSLTNFNRFIALGHLSLYEIHDRHDGLREQKHFLLKRLIVSPTSSL